MPVSPFHNVRTTLQPRVVVPAFLVIFALLLACALYPRETDTVVFAAQRWVVSHFDWLYVLAVTAFLVFLVIVASSRFGRIRLGPDDAQPQFSFLTWCSMLFSAGMGIGLMYFGVAEPIQHFAQPQVGEAGTPTAASLAMMTTVFHWGFHAWAIYGVTGLSLAYASFRLDQPLTFRSGLYPLLGERTNGWWGHAVDAFALVGTVAGIATTLGFGVVQISAGLESVTGFDTSKHVFRLALVAIVALLAGVSAASGLDKGLRRLSELNLQVAILLLIFIVVAGPTLFLARALAENVGNYLSGIVQMSLTTHAYDLADRQQWLRDWTILYWAWWISWSPFVGLFIARISRGRTIRQFVVGVLLVPSAFNLLWMTVFGDTAIWLDIHRAAGALTRAAPDVDMLLFRFFDYLPFTRILSIGSIALVAVFFVTSADSGAFVIDSMATLGSEKSPVWQRLLWAALLGSTAGILLVAGGLKALQAVTLVAALPVVGIMVIFCVGLWRGLNAADPPI